MKKLIPLIIVIILINSSILYSQNEQTTITKEETALLIIDIQYFYFPGGSVPLFEPEKASDNAAEVLKAFREKEMLVVHIRHNAKSGGDIYPDVLPVEGEKVISKNEANSFAS